MAPDEQNEWEKLLVPYWDRMGGTLYMQVKVGKPAIDAALIWIDGVRIPGGERRKGWFNEGEFNPGEFKRQVSGAEVEVVEAKAKLNREVIGQAVAAKHLLEMEYDTTTMAVPVIVCEEGHSLLERVCRTMGIGVWNLKRGFIVPERPAVLNSVPQSEFQRK